MRLHCPTLRAEGADSGVQERCAIWTSIGRFNSSPRVTKAIAENILKVIAPQIFELFGYRLRTAQRRRSLQKNARMPVHADGLRRGGNRYLSHVLLKGRVAAHFTGKTIVRPECSISRTTGRPGSCAPGACSFSRARGKPPKHQDIARRMLFG